MSVCCLRYRGGFRNVVGCLASLSGNVPFVVAVLAARTRFFEVLRSSSLVVVRGGGVAVVLF